MISAGISCECCQLRDRPHAKPSLFKYELTELRPRRIDLAIFVWRGEGRRTFGRKLPLHDAIAVIAIVAVAALKAKRNLPLIETDGQALTGFCSCSAFALATAARAASFAFLGIVVVCVI